MPSFTARIVTDDGVRTISVEASDQYQAERKALHQGQVLSIKKKFNFDITGGMNSSERNTFMLRLSSMVGSKMSTTAALDLLATTFTGNIRKCAVGLLNKIESGMSLAEAIDEDRKNFPMATAALVKAGTQGSGETWKSLRDAADFEYLIAGIQKGASKEIMSSIGSFFIAAALMITTVYYFGPQVTENKMFSNSAAVDVGWIETTGKILCLIQIIMLVIFLGFFWLGTAGRALFPNVADKIILKVPYYKDLVLSRNSYVVLYKFGLLVKSGIPMEESLALTADGSPKGALRSDIERALLFIRTGKTWPNALETLHPTDRAALASSADREDAARTLDMLATQYRDMYMNRIKSFAPALKMISALFMTAAGGLLFGLTMLPMLQFSAGAL